MREDSRRITSNRARTLGSIAVIAVLVCVSATGGTAAKVKAIKVNPIIVDGNITDWAGVPTFYLQEGPRVTAIAHDERFLYVHFRFSDAKLARQLLMTGAIVWVNGDGKHEAGFGVRYRGSAAIEETLGQSQGREGGPPAPPPGTEPPSGRPDFAGEERKGPPKSRKEPVRPPLGALEVLRLGVVSEVVQSGVQPDGLAAASAVIDGAFSFEFRFPLEGIGPSQQPRGGESRKAIAVGFQMVGVTKAETEAMRKQMRSEGGPPGSGPGGGGAGGPGGGFGGPGGGGFGGPGGGGFGGPGGGPAGGPPGGAPSQRPAEILWVDVEFLDTKPLSSSRFFPDVDEYWGRG